MIAIAALALGLTIGGADYEEALARARRFETDAKAQAFLEGTLEPKLQLLLQNGLGACRKQRNPKSDALFFVISYRDGKPDRILLRKDTPFGRCIAEALTAGDYPLNPPYPDLAVEQGFAVQTVTHSSE
jgi:hypothetical protein